MAAPATPDFLGRGWSFPPAFSRAAGSVAMVADLEDIRQSLWILMRTTPGERIMLPGYGCDLIKFLFRALTTGLMTEIKDMVGTAIVMWEPRIDLLGVTVTADADVAGLILINVDFRVRITNARSNMVYPFYLTEATLAPEG